MPSYNFGHFIVYVQLFAEKNESSPKQPIAPSTHLTEEYKFMPENIYKILTSELSEKHKAKLTYVEGNVCCDQFLVD